MGKNGKIIYNINKTANVGKCGAVGALIHCWWCVKLDF